MNVRMTKILAFLLATVMLYGVLSTSAILANKDDTASTHEKSLDSVYDYNAAQLEKLIGVDSYFNYLKEYEDVEAAGADDTILINYENLVDPEVGQAGAYVYADNGEEVAAADLEKYLAEDDSAKEETAADDETAAEDEAALDNAAATDDTAVTDDAAAADQEADEDVVTDDDAADDTVAAQTDKKVVDNAEREIITSTADVKIIDASEMNAGHFDYVDEEDYVTGKAVSTGASGETVFKFYVPKTALYSMNMIYTSNPQPSDDENMADTEISTTIERMLYIDGALPFSETRYLYFPRCWTYEYLTLEEGKSLEDMGYDPEDYTIVEVENPDGTVSKRIVDKEYNCYTFPVDKNGNDTRPRRWEVAMWQEYFVRDWLGYEKDPFQFYLDEGWHTLTLVSNREEMVISGIEFYGYEAEPTYDEWIEELKAEGKYNVIKDCEPQKIQAENPEYISVQNVIPGNDRTSSITEPQDPAVIKYNILDNGGNNNWMKYRVYVEEDGLYNLAFRFRQNSLIGMFSSRRVKINGETQFKEASELRFMYETSFQSSFANSGPDENGKDTKYMFYLEEGWNTVEIEIVLGEMEDYVYRIEQIIDELNDAYQKMIMITGPVPDSYRDYGFQALVPDCIVTIGNAAQELYEISESIVEMTGEEGDQTNTLLTIAETLKLMAMNEYEIAPNFLTFKNYIISLSDWLYAALGQPLKLDYFVVCDSEEELPQDTSSTLETIWFECRAFVASFTMDYTTIGFADDGSTKLKDTIEMWSISDRESMLIHRYLVDNYFTPKTQISLRIKVITAGLQEAILAGIGPDISFLDTVNTITFGMRTAIEPIQDMPGFKDIMDEFSYDHVVNGEEVALEDNVWYKKVSMTALNEDTGKEEYNTYGLPTTLIVPMAFYRVDVLHELGVGLPESWDELLDAMPALLNGNLDVGISTALPGAQLFIYQQEGGDLFKDDGYRTNLDSVESLSAFKTLCEMFQKYSCPVAYDITRFRTGEIPIMVSEDGLTIYNTLMTYYELRGLWQMAPAIGTAHYNEDGSLNYIDHTAVANTVAMIMPRDGDHTEQDKLNIWTFMKWYCGSESQQRQAREAMAVSLPTNKFSTANVEAFLAQKWTDDERAAVKGVLSSLETVPEYPGSYILTQYVSFAFLNAYNEGQNPADAMLEQVTYINKEIARKRKEFGLGYEEVKYEADEEKSASSD